MTWIYIIVILAGAAFVAFELYSIFGKSDRHRPGQ